MSKKDDFHFVDGEGDVGVGVKLLAQLTFERLWRLSGKWFLKQ